MNERQKKIFWSFLALLMLSQCVAVIVSFAAAPDALRVWVSPTLVRGSQAALRAVVVGDSGLSHRKGVHYTVSLHQGRSDEKLIERTVEGPTLDFGFLVPYWETGPAQLRVRSQIEGIDQTVTIRLMLVDQPQLGVRWVEPWRAFAGASAADPVEAHPERANNLPVVPFPETGWAVRNLPLPLIVARKSGATLRVRVEGDTGVGTVFDTANLAQLTMPQPMLRGRYRIETADATGTWEAHDLWLHNPPSELQLRPEAREVEPGQTIGVALHSDSRTASYTLQIYHGAQWERMTEVAMSKGKGTLHFDAPAKPCWISIVWASDLVTDSRRKAFTTVRVGSAALPGETPDKMAHPGSDLGRRALLSRVHPLRLQPPLRADTTALRKAQVEEDKQLRQRYAGVGFQMVTFAFIGWLILNILALQASRRRSRKAAQLEFEEAEALRGNPFQTLGTILLLLGLLSLLLMMGYLFKHMIWGW